VKEHSHDGHQADAAVARSITVIYGNPLLHLDSAANRTVDAVERDQKRIPAGLHDVTTVFANRGVDESPTERAKSPQGSGIIKANKSAIADHVGVNDRDEPSTACGLAGKVRVEPTRVHCQTLTKNGVLFPSVPL
jgi:hypothetical protein